MLAANAIQQGERSVVSPIKANYIVIWLMIVWNCQVVNRQAERRPNASIICQESACGAIAYQLMKNIPSIKQKTSDRRLTWDIHSVGVVLSAETVRTRKACSRRPDSGDEGKKSKQKKSVGGRERGGRTPLSPSSFLPHFFSSDLLCACTTIHCLNTWNRLAPKKSYIPLKNEHKEL